MNIATLLLPFLSLLSAQPQRFGTPACAGPDEELAVRSTFLICHSSTWKVPVWTAYELKPDQLHGTAARLKHFRRDADLSGSGARDSDYRNSGFSRGHMVPATDLAWSEESIRATFLLSNAVPQIQAANAGVWRRLEEAVRRIAAESDAVFVFTGVLFEDEEIATIGAGHVAVPSHTFKVLLAIRGERKTMYAAIVPNKPMDRDELNRHTVSVAEVQRRTGLDFFNRLEDDEEIELESQRRTFSARVKHGSRRR
ncbi:MAG: DNA/RNA non-specific endonuclease [Candidatus Solibacter usitatus]|nr:DNA/RNA non-specific endonuclease [Candidatus Solibacter usitatus]